MPLEWKDSYKLGNEIIDSEHERAFQLANQFIEATGQEQLTMTAMRLYKHTREHFEHEEAVMRSVGYPDVKEHTGRHNQLISRLNVITQSIAQGNIERQALITLMTDWAMHHIATDDAQLASYISSQSGE